MGSGRPVATGLPDPMIEVRPSHHQIDDLLGEIRTRIERGEKVLVTTLTKRMAEELTKYIAKLNIACRYIHSDVETLERVAINGYPFQGFNVGVNISAGNVKLRYVFGELFSHTFGQGRHQNFFSPLYSGSDFTQQIVDLMVAWSHLDHGVRQTCGHRSA